MDSLTFEKHKDALIYVYRVSGDYKKMAGTIYSDKTFTPSPNQQFSVDDLHSITKVTNLLTSL